MANKKSESDPAVQLPECPTPKGKLLATGGSESKEARPKEGSNQENNKNFIPYQILERFCQELRGDNALVAVFPTASAEPDSMGDIYWEVFSKLGITNVEVLNIQSRQDAENPLYMEIMERATGFMLTGGDQLRLTAILGGTPLLERLKGTVHARRNPYCRYQCGGSSLVYTHDLFGSKRRGLPERGRIHYDGA